MSKTEYWKPIEETNNEYWISSKGRIASVVFRNNNAEHMRIKYIKPTNNGNGYLAFLYRYDGNHRRTLYVHRLVAKYFIGEVEGKPYVNHIDYNRQNNNVENLEWCTAKENADHSHEHYCKPKSKCTTSTGYKYITKRGDKYRCSLRFLSTSDKYFKTLEEALAYRKEALGNKYEFYITGQEGVL